LEGTTHYSYNIFNQLIQVEKPESTQIEYRYDAIGRRIAKVVDGNLTQFVWNQFQLIGEEQASKRIEYVFYPEHFIPLCHLEEDKAYFYQIDQLGTVREVTDDDGQLLWSGNYQAFGQCQVDNSARITNPLRFPGQYWDEETELHYNQFRYYDPQTGRYLTKDPISYLSGDFNLYRYGKNDPVNQSDVLGLEALVAGWAVALAEPTPVGEIVMSVITVFNFIAMAITISSISGDTCQGCSEMANEEADSEATADDGETDWSQKTDKEVNDASVQGDKHATYENNIRKAKKAQNAGLPKDAYGPLGENEVMDEIGMENIEKAGERIDTGVNRC
jgi:RHS repeat-associated protein